MPTCRFEWRSSSALVVRFGGWRSLRNSTGRCWDDRPPARMLRCSPAWCRKEPQNASPPAGHGRIGQAPRRDGRSRRPESRCNTHRIAWHRVRHDRETRAVEADGSSRRRVAGPRPMTWTLTLTLTMTVTVHGPDPRPVPDRVPVRDGPQLARGDVQLANGGCIALPGSAEIPQMREMPQIRHTMWIVTCAWCQVALVWRKEEKSGEEDSRKKRRSEEGENAARQQLQGTGRKRQ